MVIMGNRDYPDEDKTLPKKGNRLPKEGNRLPKEEETRRKLPVRLPEIKDYGQLKVFYVAIANNWGTTNQCLGKPRPRQWCSWSSWPSHFHRHVGTPVGTTFHGTPRWSVSENIGSREEQWHASALEQKIKFHAKFLNHEHKNICHLDSVFVVDPSNHANTDIRDFFKLRLLDTDISQDLDDPFSHTHSCKPRCSIFSCYSGST